MSYNSNVMLHMDFEMYWSSQEEDRALVMNLKLDSIHPFLEQPSMCSCGGEWIPRGGRISHSSSCAPASPAAHSITPHSCAHPTETTLRMKPKRACLHKKLTWKRHNPDSMPPWLTPWIIQTMEFSRPEYWSGLPYPSPGDLLNPGIELRSPALQAGSLPAEPPEKP